MTTFAEVPLNELFHEYDPVAAREYYLRTRELKGRKPGAGPQPPQSVRTAAAAEAAAKAAKLKKDNERKAARAKLQKRLEDLDNKLDQLQFAMKQAKVAAMRKAGNVSEETLSRMISQEVKSPGSSKTKEGRAEAAKAGEAKSAKDAKPKEKTASQKRDAAKAAKEKYEKEHPDAGKQQDSNSDVQEKVDAAEKKLANLQKRLEALKRIAS